MNHLSDDFYTVPHLAKKTMTKRELRETLLHTGGYIFANGRSWEIVSKHIGGGVYKITLIKQFGE